MSHSRYNGAHVFECDVCGDEFGQLEGQGADFHEVWGAAKDDGWVCYNDGNGWNHVCPDCR